MSSTELQYPPSAAQPGFVSTQPAGGPSMSIASATHKKEEEKAARLRGGCIPCPDGGCCYIIPIPCCC
ncbi:hypothetical protein GLOTRDRAFT_141558 [Gloeophyllum trabeum ATCC 11539]|uniref:Uncharacterized protein n=1 Tax=Gloeophyllum trabeum (strain ATCC 11539 / FP-39264 / Madison 617) TaxID=670483 RepID=S7PSC2_GLOTA|nr:uncharacterized protein GLOTRDRAFT_141558 [Gloeophyllum trabeum ATCC 11539]EPQ50308.1 hypothetical protein GLOTRDRAFT_141558 [Gloeophyllum trabeum ATCC 11539]